jgi:hypothetical protein
MVPGIIGDKPLPKPVARKCQGFLREIADSGFVIN